MLPPNELKKKNFTRVMRGYSSAEVDEYINFLMEQYTDLYRENNDLECKLRNTAAKLDALKKDEESIRSALVNAQRASSTIIAEANERSEAVMQMTKKTCKRILSDFRTSVAKEREELVRLRNAAEAFKAQLFDAYNTHIDLIEKINTSPEDFMKLEDSADDYVQEALRDIKSEVIDTLENVGDEVPEQEEPAKEAEAPEEAASAPVPEVPAVSETPAEPVEKASGPVEIDDETPISEEEALLGEEPIVEEDDSAAYEQPETEKADSVPFVQPPQAASATEFGQEELAEELVPVTEEEFLPAVKEESPEPPADEPAPALPVEETDEPLPVEEPAPAPVQKASGMAALADLDPEEDADDEDVKYLQSIGAFREEPGKAVPKKSRVESKPVSDSGAGDEMSMDDGGEQDADHALPLTDDEIEALLRCYNGDEKSEPDEEELPPARIEDSAPEGASADMTHVFDAPEEDAPKADLAETRSAAAPSKPAAKPSGSVKSAIKELNKLFNERDREEDSLGEEEFKDFSPLGTEEEKGGEQPSTLESISEYHEFLKSLDEISKEKKSAKKGKRG